MLYLSLMLASSIEMECLWKNAYFESRNQSDAGITAVTHVVLNRIQSDNYPDTVCEVTQQAKLNSLGQIIRNKCQFSWYCDGLSDRPREEKAYAHIKKVVNAAKRMYLDEYDLSYGSTHYHAKTVEPYWADSFEYVMQIDDHLFYREAK